MEKENLYSGHRERLLTELTTAKDRTVQSESRILEALLFYAVPRRDTKLLAHKLLNHFGSLNALIDAGAEELDELDYLTPRIKQFFIMLNITNERYQKEKLTSATIMTFGEEVEVYMRQRLANENEEVLGICYFNAKGKFLGFETVANGNFDSLDVDLRIIAQHAISRRAVAIALAHNHPSGDSRPSQQDIQSTLKLKNALNGIGVDVIEHYIITENQSTSFSSIEECRFSLNTKTI